MSDLPAQHDRNAPQLTPDPPVVPSRTNPYIGPRAYQWGEHIYGRDLETYKLANLLSAERIVLFYSPSGAGKTSLIHAALIPELQEREFYVRPVARINREPANPPASLPPSYNRYIFSILSWLESALPENEQISEEELIGMRLADYLKRRPRPADSNFEVFIFDQFEEILTLDATDQAAKHEFFEQVGDLLGDRTRWGLFAMREDFKAALDPYVLPIPTRFSATFRLELLGVEAARQAMQGPAKNAGVIFSSPAADALIDDLRLVQVQNPDGTYRTQLGPYVEPVQLQVVCYRLWESLEAGATQIDQQHLAKIKNVGQALADYYSMRVAEAAQKANVGERLIRQWFDRELITEGGIRGQVLMGAQSSRGLENRAIHLLEDAHLVRAEKRGNSIWYELSHDRLIEPVKENNAAWFEAHLSLLQRQASLWEERERNEALLLREKALDEAEAWAIAHATEMTSTERDYLKACQEYRKRESEAKALVEKEIQLQEQAKSAVRLRRRAYVLTVALLVTVVLTVVAIFLGNQASQNASIAEQNASAAHANLNTAETASVNEAIQRQTAVAASTQAVAQQSLAETASTQAVAQAVIAQVNLNTARTAEAQALEQKAAAQVASTQAIEQQKIAENERLKAISGQLASYSDRAIQNSPDLGLLLAIEALSVTNTIEAQSSLLQGLTANEHLLAYLRGNTGSVFDLEFSPDSKLLASAAYDGLHLWDVDRRLPNTQTLTITVGMQRVAFSPDGSQLVVVDCYGSVYMQEISLNHPAAFSEKSILNFPNVYDCSTSNMGDLVFSPTGDRLAVSLNSDTILLRDITASKTLTLTGSASTITHLAFSPDGSFLAYGNQAGGVGVWDSRTGAPTHPLMAKTDQPFSGAITLLKYVKAPDGKIYLFAGDDKGFAAIWEYPDHKLFSQPADTGIKNMAAIDLQKSLFVSLDGNKLYLESNIQNLQTLTGHAALITSVNFNADSTILASGSADGTIILWSPTSSTLYDPPLLTKKPILDLTFLQNGGQQTLIGSSADQMLTWDATSHQLLHTVTLPLTVTTQITITPVGLAFRPDGKLVVAGSDGAAYLWDLPTRQGSRISTIGLPAMSNPSINISSQGDKILLGDYSSVYIWDITTTHTISIAGDFGSISRPILSPDGKLVAFPDFYTSLYLADAPTGKIIDKLSFGGGGDVAFSPDGSILAAGSYYGSINLWDVQSRQPITTFQTLQYATVQSLAFSPDGVLLAAGSSDGSISLWNVTTRSSSGTTFNTRAGVLCLSFSPDGAYLASGEDDGTVHLWDIATGKEVGAPFTGHKKSVTSISFSPDGRWLASASTDDTIRVWEVRNGAPIDPPFVAKSQPRVAPNANTMAISSDGLKLASGSYSEGLITLFDLSATSPLTQVLSAHNGMVNTLAFSHNGRYLASGGSDGKLILWDAASGKRLSTLFIARNSSINVVKFNPDDSTLAAGIGTDIRLWDIATLKPKGAPLVGHNNTINGLAFSPDMKTMATQDIIGTIILWDLSSGNLSRRLENAGSGSTYSYSLVPLSFSPDGKVLASVLSSSLGDITLWDVASGAPLGYLNGQLGAISSLAFSPDGNTLVTSGQNNRLLFWKVSLQAWKQRACNVAGRNLTWQEWETYLSETRLDYRATCPSNPINFNDVIQWYAGQVTFLVKAQEIDQAQQTLTKAVGLITLRKDRDPAITVCKLDLPSKLLATQAPACRLAAELTTDGIESATYSLKIGDNTTAVQTLERAGKAAIHTQDTNSATQICDYGVSKKIPQGVTDACLYVANQASDDYTRVSYYIKAGAVISATTTLQRATQEVAKSNSFVQAVTICRLGNTYQFSNDVVQACMVAAQTAPNDATRVEFFALGGDSQKAIQAFQTASKVALDTQDSYTTGTLCVAAARYHLQGINHDACLFAAEQAVDHKSSADFYALAGDRVKAAEEFSLALVVATNSSDPSYSNNLCWIGSIDGFAELVLPACEYAVKNADYYSVTHYQDSRGLARALTGDIEGAISDFQALIDWFNNEGSYDFDVATRDRYIAERQSWIDAMRAGQNPFDANTLMALRDE